MSLQFFKDCFTLEQAKARYRSLAKEHYPIEGTGDEDIFKLVSIEYNLNFKHLNHKEHQTPTHSFQLFGMTTYTFSPLKGRHVMSAISISLKSNEDALFYMMASTLVVNNRSVTADWLRQQPLYILAVIARHFFSYNYIKQD